MPQFLAAALLLSAGTLLAQSSQPSATVISYHQVEASGVPRQKTVPRPGAADVSSEETRFTISHDNFVSQIDYLQQNGYQVIPLSDLIDYIKGRKDSLPSKAVVITVDDGWRSAYTEIFPILQQREMPFTLFVYPQVIGNADGYVTWPQVTEMADRGVDIEDHTFTHSFLTLGDRDDVKSDDYARFLAHELLDSKLEIEKHTGKPVRFIAYPYSTYDAAVEQAVQRYGYEAALYDRDRAGCISRSTSPMHVKRFPVLHDTTVEQFKKFLLP